ncbi:MAG: PEP-CTERM sorting domain-containing protein [Candidatus Omnitrophica bacterium]|nr:PEP-CTERM sorting domain-containing protein [Candidatus Omnitrophota bacterium]
MSRHIKSASLVLLFAATLLLGIQAAEATVLGFEDITQGNEGMPINSDYAGFVWDSNFYAIPEGNYGSANRPFPSSSKAVFNGYGVLTTTVTRSTNFDFNGAYFLPWLDQNYNTGEIYVSEWGSTTITMKGYNGSTLVGNVTRTLTNDWTYCSAELYGINRLELIASQEQRWWLMDNFTYNAEQTVVPEPATMFLFGIGGIATSLLRRKKKLS